MWHVRRFGDRESLVRDERRERRPVRPIETRVRSSRGNRSVRDEREGQNVRSPIPSLGLGSASGNPTEPDVDGTDADHDARFFRFPSSDGRDDRTRASDHVRPRVRLDGGVAAERRASVRGRHGLAPRHGALHARALRVVAVGVRVRGRAGRVRQEPCTRSPPARRCRTSRSGEAR